MLLYHLVRLVHAGLPHDFAPPAGEPGPAIRYAFTGAMHPAKKESAFMHLPTYLSGLAYHTGTFLAFPVLILWLVFHPVPLMISLPASVILLLTGASGLGILLKRILNKKLRSLSHPDDYISNFLVTVFQITTALTLMNLLPEQYLMLTTSLLLLYIPAGKLKHLLYFFSARIHLGNFYGSRGVWPPSHHQS